MNLAAATSEIAMLAAGDHVHLDVVFADHPRPGSREWFPLLEELARSLVLMEGRWFISLPVGDVDPERAVIATPEIVFDLISEPSSEPPSVHRAHDRLPTPWKGQQLSDASELERGVSVTTSLSRSHLERDRDEPWYATITFAT